MSNEDLEGVCCVCKQPRDRCPARLYKRIKRLERLQEFIRGIEWQPKQLSYPRGAIKWVETRITPDEYKELRGLIDE